jgi:eukaryotic-like serine/threonine-protein kinase
MPATLEVGQRLGPFRIEERLGQGGMGMVFRAVHDDGRVVALKVLRDELGADQSFRTRLAREARAAAEVDHPNLARVLEAGEADGRLYLAVRYVDGRSLAERLAAGGPLEVPELVRLAADVGAGLDALHRRGLVHRDVKPANLLLAADGTAVVGDFGLAKNRAWTVLTRPGQVLGTLDYLAPELIRGEPAGPMSDLYALGCVLYECLAGAPPFAGRGLLRIGMAHLEEEPGDPAAGRADVPPALAWTVRQAMAKDPSRRPPAAGTLARMLRLAAADARPTRG